MTSLHDSGYSPWKVTNYKDHTSNVESIDARLRDAPTFLLNELWPEHIAPDDVRTVAYMPSDWNKETQFETVANKLLQENASIYVTSLVSD